MMDQAAKLRILAAGDRVPEAMAYAAVPAPRWTGTRVIAVTSGKGGVGKTTVAVNLALLLAEEAGKVLIVDADLGLANVDVLLGLESARHIGHILFSDYDPDEVAAVVPGGVKVISGGSGLRDLARVSSAERRLLLDKLCAYYQQFRYVLVDTSPGIGDDVVDFLRGSDEILLVTTPEPTALRDSYAAAKTMAQEVPDIDVRVVVNAASSDRQAEETVAVLNEVAGRFLDRRYERWHRIAADPCAAKSVNLCRALVHLFPRSPAAISFRRLARSLAGAAGALHFQKASGTEGDPRIGRSGRLSCVKL